MDDEAHPDDVMQDETATEEQARLPPLSPDEQRALELYDRLQELRLEMAIVQAQQKHQHTGLFERSSRPSHRTI